MVWMPLEVPEVPTPWRDNLRPLLAEKLGNVSDPAALPPHAWAK